jgi:hypothetical protein
MRLLVKHGKQVSSREVGDLGVIGGVADERPS